MFSTLVRENVAHPDFACAELYKGPGCMTVTIGRILTGDIIMNLLLALIDKILLYGFPVGLILTAPLKSLR